MPMRVRTFTDLVAAIFAVLLVVGVQFLIVGFLVAGHSDPYSLRVMRFAFSVGFGLIIIGVLILVFTIKIGHKRSRSR